MTSADPFGLSRFRAAQATAFDGALAELRRGHKEGHWIWFVYPQMKGLGRSPTAHHFGIASADEARAYLADPVLRDRLELAIRALLDRDQPPIEARLGPLDALKFRSSMTLFEQVAAGDPLFGETLDRLCGGVRDPATLSLLARSVAAAGKKAGDER